MRYRIKLFPEITIKSRSVRKQMVRYLRSNIRHTLLRIDPKVRVTDCWDALEVEPSDKLNATRLSELETSLTRIPGIHEVLAVEAHPFVSFEETAARLVSQWQTALAGKRFRVRVKRRGQHDFSSGDLERYLGGVLLNAADGATVDLTTPQLDIHLELRDARLLLVSRRLPGLGGYPLGTQGQAMALISGGYDSPVAAWQLMRRGLKMHFLFFNLGGPAHEQAVREVTHYLWQRFSLSHKVNFISVPFDGVIDELQRQVPPGLAGVILKRMMLRAANRVATRARVPALVTGEALAQVSSQTLANLALIDAVSERPILRPLIASDKQSIINLARHIGTASYAEHLPEYCGAVSRRPHIHPKPQLIEAAEAEFDFAILDAAVAASTATRVDRLLDEAPRLAEVTVIDSPQALTAAGEVTVIDIRHPDEREAAPLVLPNVTALEIPFFELTDKAGTLPSDRQYLLYCDQGIMSKMQAVHLAAKGLSHFGVYRA